MDLPREPTTSIPHWVLAALPTLSNASDIKVLLFLAARARYRRSAFGPGELADATGLDYRTTTASLRRLSDEGHIVSAAGAHALRGACTTVAQRLHKSTPTSQPEKPVQDGKNRKPTRAKDLEGLKRTQRDSKRPPPTPHGGEARESTAPGSGPVPLQMVGPEEATAQPVQVQTQPPTGEGDNATSSENVPARRPAPGLPPLPDDLAALPGMPAAWDAWMAYRRERRLATAPSTATGMFNKLRVLSAEGQNPVEVIQTSIDNGWQGLFPVRAANVKFTPRPQTIEQADARFVANMTASAAAIQGVFGD